jgi:hypothetical protein
MDRALAAAVDRAIDRAQATGQLQWFNRLFAAARKQNPKLSYRVARIRLRNAMMARIGCGEWLTAELIAEIFPIEPRAEPRPFDKTRLRR